MTPWIIASVPAYIAAVVGTWVIVAGKLNEWEKECQEASSTIDDAQEGILGKLGIELVNVVKSFRSTFKFVHRPVRRSTSPDAIRLKVRESTKELAEKSINLDHRIEELKEVSFLMVNGSESLKKFRKRLMIAMFPFALACLLSTYSIFTTTSFSDAVGALLLPLYVVFLPLIWVKKPYDGFRKNQRTLKKLMERSLYNSD